MSTGKYVVIEKDENGEETIELTEEAYLNNDNIDSVQFTFSPGDDITENLNKKEDRERTTITATKKGRVAYSSLTCRYPNGETSSKIMLQGCVAQYREGIKKKPSTDYGRGYVCIGIPERYVNKLIKDAKSRSKLTVTTKPKVKKQEGYFWFDCTLDRITSNDCILLYNNEGELGGIPASLRDMFEEMESNINVDIMFTCSASQTTESMSEKIDLERGTYFLTLKPTKIYMTTESSTKGPTLDDTNRRSKETITPSTKSMASGRLLELAMRKMKVNN